MTTKTLLIGLGVLVVLLGAWTAYAGKGAVPWYQQQGQQGEDGSSKPNGQGRGGQQRQQRSEQQHQRGQQQQSGSRSQGEQSQQGQQSQQYQKQQQQQGHQEEGEGDPADWTEEELKAYLENRGETVDENTETRVMLLARVQDLKADRT